MIPLRIFLKGFLCYREPQEFRFDGASLWMLSGLNGSGKSTVFDALTYALFGQHRDGSQDALELIHKGVKGLAVEVDFDLDGTRYRAQRTLQRGARGRPSVSQQLRRYVPPAPGDDGPGHWEPVPDTTRKADFNAWVREHLGLSYETFTSSVLLMQGQSEKLISAKKADRFQVLSAIVDLERFGRLHERADRRRLALKAEAEGLQRRLAVVPEVPDEAIEAAAQAIASVQERTRRAQDEVDRLQGLDAQARRWTALQAERAKLQAWCDQAQDLLAETPAIERDLDRLNELQAVLPHLVIAIEQRDRLERSNRASAALEAEQAALEADLRRRDDDLERAERDWNALKGAIADNERRERALADRLRVLSALLAIVNLCDQQRRKRDQLEKELAADPPDLAEACARDEAELARLTALSQALAPLGRLREEREGLRLALRRQSEAAEAGRAALDRGRAIEAEVVDLARALSEANAEWRTANDRAIELRMLRNQAALRRREIDKLAGSPECCACGQPLTPEHLQAERARRDAEVESAERQSRQAEHAAAEAAGRERAILEIKAGADTRLAAETRLAEMHQRDAQHAAEAAERHARQCLSAYRELAEPFRSWVSPEPPSGWLATNYPTAEEIESARREVERLEALRTHQARAKRALEKKRLLEGQRDAVQQTLDEQERALPGDLAKIRTENDRLAAEDRALKDRLNQRRGREKATPKALERLRQERDAVRRRIEEKTRQGEVERARRAEYREALARARAALPAAWSDRAESATTDDLRAWQEERDALRARGTEARAEALRQARSQFDLQRRRLAELDEEQAEFPTEARCDPGSLCDRLAEAQARRDRCMDDLVAARRRADQLHDARAERARLDEEFRAADKAHRTAALLARLLGPDHLQRHLVRQAERRIVAISNGILDRLSGGQLRLDLRPESPGGRKDDEALDLVAYNKTAGPDPIGVAFLSGSQRFRVAVSLALGIGRYAGRQHRPIQSVIIDEGFGCLDRQGRQFMIQELQNLRGELDCILLVSHQEEFAQAFPNGYQLELRDGTTIATRFQR